MREDHSRPVLETEAAQIAERMVEWREEMVSHPNC